MSRALAPAKVPARNSAAAVSVAIGEDLDMAVGQAVDRLAHRELGVGMNDGGAAFGLRQHDGVGLCRRDRVEIGVGQAGLQAVDAHHHDTAAPRCRHRVLEKGGRAAARARLAVGRDRILEVDDQRVGAARHRLVELLGAVGGDEQERAHGRPAGRLRRRHLGRIWPHTNEGLAAAFGDQLVVLVEGAVMEFDDAGAGPRLRFALADDFGGAMHGVALEQRMRKFDVGHAEIGDRGADRHVGDLNADHEAEREQRVHQRLAPFGLLLAEVPVDMQRLRVERHVGEQHVVHLGDGAGVAVLDEFAGDEILEIEPAALVPNGRLLAPFSPPRSSQR